MKSRFPAGVLLPAALLHLSSADSSAAVLDLPQAKNAAILVSLALFYFGFKWRSR